MKFFNKLLISKGLFHWWFFTMFVYNNIMIYNSNKV